MSSGQVCRPHFHAPLHPWLSDGTKPLTHSAPWVPFGSADPDKSQSPSSAAAGGGGQPHNIFSFPPTPPKDSTPDSVAPTGGGAEYQSAVAAAMGAFMHENPQSCALDVKPSAATGGKQREGSDYEGASSGMFNGNFESSYGSTYGHSIHGYSSQANKQQHLTGQGAQSPNKPRNKSRTSAGKKNHHHQKPTTPRSLLPIYLFTYSYLHIFFQFILFRWYLGTYSYSSSSQFVFLLFTFPIIYYFINRILIHVKTLFSVCILL